MQGVRSDATVVEGELTAPWLPLGGYGKGPGGVWYCRCPGETEGDDDTRLIGNLARHTVTEHEDGTITVSPSIAAKNHVREWHGYLERGVWRAC